MRKVLSKKTAPCSIPVSTLFPAFYIPTKGALMYISNKNVILLMYICHNDPHCKYGIVQFDLHFVKFVWRDILDGFS